MIKYHSDLIQGTDEWRRARCGIITASEMKLIVTPTFRPANNEKERFHLYELLAQRITRYVEPTYIGDDMLRGQEDEIEARALYAEHYAPVREVGFVTNDRFGFIIGCSPDGLVGDDGLLECKSRRQKFQVETIINNVAENEVPLEYMLQIQTGLLVTERSWCDFVSYSGGLPMVTIRVLPIPDMRNAIIDVATAFEERLAEKMDWYHSVLKSKARLIATERRAEEEIVL